MRGKTHAQTGHTDEQIKASMRPPHECGGKLPKVSAKQETPTSFNEAPARMRGKTAEASGLSAARYLLQ